LASGELTLPVIEPQQIGKVDLESFLPSIHTDKEVFLTVSLHLRHAQAWAKHGHEIAWHQHRLSIPKAYKTSDFATQLVSQLNIKNGQSTVTVSGPAFSFTFDSARGYLMSWIIDGVSVLEPDAAGAAIRPGFWRPPTDNDQPKSLPYWQRFGVDALTSQSRGLTIARSAGPEQSPQTVTLTAKTFLSPPVLDWGWHVTTEYTISTTGTLRVDVSLSPSGSKPTHIPRIGLDCRLPRRLDAVRWHGLGPGESYPDKAAAQRVGIWEVDSVAELHTPYEVPQEDGNRMGTRWVTLTEAQGAGLRASGGINGEFSFRASRYADRTVQEAKHPCDLVEEDATLLRLDVKVAGVGTGACGPGVREDLLVKAEPIKFGFLLEPIGV
jgi:beta-galactosidase